MLLSMWDLSSSTRTEPIPCAWEVQSQPLDHKGSPLCDLLWLQDIWPINQKRSKQHVLREMIPNIIQVPTNAWLWQWVWKKKQCLNDHKHNPEASQVALVVKNLPANAGHTGWIPGLGGSPGKGNGNPLQYSCLGNPMAWTEEPGGLQSMGPPRVRHDWAIE